MRPRELSDLFNCSASWGKNEASIQKLLGFPCPKTFYLIYMMLPQSTWGSSINLFPNYIPQEKDEVGRA